VVGFKEGLFRTVSWYRTQTSKSAVVR